MVRHSGLCSDPEPWPGNVFPAVRTGQTMFGERKGHNRFAVGNVWGTLTRSGSFLATLGLEAESRWDSRWVLLALLRNRDAPAKALHQKYLRRFWGKCDIIWNPVVT